MENLHKVDINYFSIVSIDRSSCAIIYRLVLRMQQTVFLKKHCPINKAKQCFYCLTIVVQQFLLQHMLPNFDYPTVFKRKTAIGDCQSTTFSTLSVSIFVPIFTKIYEIKLRCRRKMFYDEVIKQK